MERENLLQGLHRDAPGSDGSYFFVRLSFKGWEQAEILRQTTRDNRLGFMAMAFNIERLEKVFDQCFKSAAKDAGFELCRLSDGQGAGLIDAQLRVRIRAAKFLLADLSTGNKGAYWEAGFAEGLGLPVIYVCERKMWENEDRSMRPHFDTNHMNTVVWKDGELDQARVRLRNMIRDTFPAEATIGPD